MPLRNQSDIVPLPKAETRPDQLKTGPDELKMKGAMVVRLRGLSQEEREAESWQNHPDDIPCIEFDNGAVLYSGCERCDKPGTIYATFEGHRWGIDSAGEPYERPPRRKRVPSWVYQFAVLAVLLGALAAAGYVALQTLSHDQRARLNEQVQIMKEQRTVLEQQLANQRRTNRMIRANQMHLEKMIHDVRGRVDSAMGEQQSLRQSYEDLNRRLGQLSATRGRG